MRRTVVVVPRIVMPVVDHPPVFVGIRRENVHRCLEVVVDHPRLEFQRGQPRHPASGKARDNAGLEP